MEKIKQNIQLPDLKLTRILIVDKPKQGIFRWFTPTNKKIPTVIRLDKYGNFKMYEQFFDLQVGDIRKIPTLTTHQMMLEKYLENWFFTFKSSQTNQTNQISQISQKKEEESGFCDSFWNSINVINNIEKIENRLSTLEDQKNSFLFLPHLVTTPLNKKQSLILKADELSSSEKN